MKTAHRGSRASGFTLIELMIVVAIIGILAAVAIPNFLKWTCKSRQSECSTTLTQISKLMKGYYVDDGMGGAARNSLPDTYLGANFSSIGMKWDGGRRYSYVLGAGASLVQNATGNNDANYAAILSVCSSAGGGNAGVAATPGQSFTVEGCGNVDNDTDLDGWTLRGSYGDHNEPQHMSEDC